MNKQILSELSNNNKKLYFIVNHIFSIKELMEETKDKGIYCPFHGESRASGSKPSARFYENQEPIKLWCFSERRSYYSYHYIQQIMKRNPLNYLISNASEKKILYYLNQYKEENTDEEQEDKLIITSLDQIDKMYRTLDASWDYSKWYII